MLPTAKNANASAYHFQPINVPREHPANNPDQAVFKTDPVVSNKAPADTIAPVARSRAIAPPCRVAAKTAPAKVAPVSPLLVAAKTRLLTRRKYSVNCRRRRRASVAEAALEKA